MAGGGFKGMRWCVGSLYVVVWVVQFRKVSLIRKGTCDEVKKLKYSLCLFFVFCLFVYLPFPGQAILPLAPCISHGSIYLFI